MSTLGAAVPEVIPSPKTGEPVREFELAEAAIQKTWGAYQRPILPVTTDKDAEIAEDYARLLYAEGQ